MRKHRYDFSDDEKRMAEGRLPKYIQKKTHPTYRGTQVRYAVRIGGGQYGQFKTIEEATARRNWVVETYKP